MKKGRSNNTTNPNFLYRIELCDKQGECNRHLAEVVAPSDEEARRKIIHKALAEGGRVVSIMPTEDSSRYPGEAAKKMYAGPDIKPKEEAA